MADPEISFISSQWPLQIVARNDRGLSLIQTALSHVNKSAFYDKWKLEAGRPLNPDASTFALMGLHKLAFEMAVHREIEFPPITALGMSHEDLDQLVKRADQSIDQLRMDPA